MKPQPINSGSTTCLCGKVGTLTSSTRPDENTQWYCSDCFFKKKEATKGLHGTKYVEESKALMKKVLNHELDWLDLCDAMHEINKKYPNLGWDVEANKIYNSHARKEGLPNIV